MSQDYIGVVVTLNSNMVVAVINPDDDQELNNPKLLLMTGTKEPLMMVRIPRGDYGAALSLTDVADLVGKYRER